MKNYFSLRNSVSLLILCSVYSSCQKEISFETSTTRTSDNDSTILLRYIDLDTSQMVGLDTLAIAGYSYDNLHRLIRSSTKEYTSGTLNDSSTSELFYNGSDTLPNKIISKYFDLTPGGLASNSFVDYCAYTNEKLVYDSAIGSTGSLVFRFSYVGDNITESIFNNNHNIYVTRNSGNTILQIDTNSAFQPHRFNFNYDTKHNPFYRPYQIFKDMIKPYYHMETFSEEMCFEKNNPTDIDEFEDLNEFHFKYVYEYNLNGYPTVARVFDLGDPSNFYKRIFIYTKL